jgi:RNA polymerase sigma factor (sigma-70 family)
MSSKHLRELDPGMICAARNGEPAALEYLLKHTQQDVKRFARRSCANAEDAEDAVQVALWRLHRKLGTLRLIQALSSWLFRIVERECRRLLRLRQYHADSDDLLLAVLPAATVPLDLRRDLSRAIGALPLLYREVLILRDIEEMSAAEVAQQLQISVDAVKTRLHRARQMLREALITSGYWFGDTE